MKCLLDLDGVIVDFVSGACNLHKRENPYNNKENWGKYYLEELFQIQLDDFWKGMEYDFWLSLDFMHDAKEILEVIETYIPRKNICLLSSPSKNRTAIAGKIAWIEHHLPAYRRRFLIGPQKEFCANPRHILIDDFDKNVTKFAEAGGQSLLIPRPWNSRYLEVGQSVPNLIKNHLELYA